MNDYVFDDELTFTIYDKDTVKNEILGIGKLTCARFQEAGFEGDLELTDTGQKSGAALNVKIALPPVKSLEDMLGSLAPSSAAAAHVVSVTIVGARGLRDADWGRGSSDAYCVCEVKGKPHTKFKTQVVNDSLEPMWNHTSQIEDYFRHEDLDFAIYDEDAVKHELLGRATLTSAQLSGSGFEGDLELSEAGKGITAFLKVKISLKLAKKAVPAGSSHGHGREEDDI
eukprot:gnl/TRDRNA2_/TRDRNA2_176872_c5_seq4.p1 gnl/TRDRNA2_/TRDRNA2_176872_c5~~gnl/TRDRNA2_/TRDRNA2_176872_c5_seq4.p1  ORF type:complete len:227 (-),score=55.87 gnl/TRDRNA2_/TRDRNA2_176872_c5_seq4:461-1141(-)